jgi:tetratricopeptide (TPR) repeat protein
MKVIALVAVLSAALPACATDKTARIRDAEKTVREEQTPEKLVRRGKMFARLGDYTRASQYFGAALDAGADPHVVLPLLMRTYVVSQRFRLAIEVGERYLAKNPRDHYLRFLVATLYSAVDQPDRARQHLERVLAENPANAEAHYVLAVLLRDRQRDWVGADHHFRQYLRLEPAGPHAEEARGSLLKSVP